MQWWLVFAFVSVAGWGGGYAVLKVVKLDPMVIATIYGLAMSLISFIVQLIQTNGDREVIAKAWVEVRNQPYLFLYIILMVSASVCYFVASQMQGVSNTLLTGLTSNYPLVTMALTFALFSEYKLLDLRFAIPGLTCTALGAVFLALAPKAAAVLPQP